jgi:hypothetical protein
MVGAGPVGKRRQFDGAMACSHRLDGGVDSRTVRDNLRHASVSTISICLHSHEIKRARQMSDRPHR